MDASFSISINKKIDLNVSLISNGRYRREIQQTDTGGTSVVTNDHSAASCPHD